MQHFIETPKARPLSLRETLKAATKDLHDQIERLWMPAQSFHSKRAYLSFLGASLAVHRSIGLPAARGRADDVDIEQETTRINALCLDLDGQVGPHPRLETLSAAEAWGASYVLNGSALGATMMLSRGYIGQDWPTSYLQVGREYARSGLLNGFLRRLNNLTFNPEDVLSGASRTFAAYADHAQQRDRTRANHAIEEELPCPTI